MDAKKRGVVGWEWGPAGPLSHGLSLEEGDSELTDTEKTVIDHSTLPETSLVLQCAQRTVVDAKIRQARGKVCECVLCNLNSLQVHRKDFCPLSLQPLIYDGETSRALGMSACHPRPSVQPHPRLSSEKRGRSVGVAEPGLEPSCLQPANHTATRGQCADSRLWD